MTHAQMIEENMSQEGFDPVGCLTTAPAPKAGTKLVTQSASFSEAGWVGCNRSSVAPHECRMNVESWVDMTWQAIMVK